MTTNIKDYILKHNEYELGEVFRDTLEDHFDHDFYIKSFRNQLESDDEVDNF